MNILIRVATVVLLAAGALLAFSSVASAQEVPRLTDEQRSRIASNCLSIKSTLAQLHASDALLRVNRGKVYESMATKLMDSFNSRLSSNRLDAKATSAVTSSYRTALNTFRVDYRLYEEKLSATLRLDCTKEPQQFYESLESARSLRKTVHEDVLKLHRYIDDYRSAVGDFLLNYKRVSE